MDDDPPFRRRKSCKGDAPSSRHIADPLAVISRPLFALVTTALVASGAPVDFGRDVLPILSDACFHCHGPDENKREAKLRLDTREGLYRTLDGVTVVTPGKPDESELVLRVSSHDRDEVMPPPKANRQLKPEDVATLKRWVSEGAPYGKHWSFEAMKRPVPPEEGDPIDAFVQARLKAEGLNFSAEADRARLLRRVTFDLTGLPPTSGELDAFLADATPDAYVRVVDRLLASPRYGERMATDWLDVARYADTHGYQKDATRSVWPWRDWVIHAFNQDLPFDQFVTWQIAGDLLPNATKEQKLATAFNRLHMQNEEGGIVGEEFRVAYVVDRVNTFGTAFLGLTTECSRCHDHKYDPLTQHDFYSLFAFFQNVDEAGQIPFSGFVDDMPEPVLLLSTPEQDQQIAAVRTKIAAKGAERNAVVEQSREPFATWKQAAPRIDSSLGCIARFDFESITGDQLLNLIDPKKTGKAHDQPKLIPGHTGQAAELDGENGFTFPGIGHFNRAQSFSLSIWIRPAKPNGRTVILHHTKAPEDAANRGYELTLEDGHLCFGLHHFYPGNSIKLRTLQPLKENAWVQVTATYDGSSRASGTHIYLDGVLTESEIVRDCLSKDFSYGGGEPDLTIGYRFRDTGFKDGAVDEFAIYDRELTAVEAAQLAGVPIEPGDKLFDTYLSTISEPVRKWRSELASLRDEERRLVQPIPEMMVMKELPQPKKAYILKRGAYDSHGDEVTADTPKFLPAFPADAPRNRLGLARWLLDPENPLMARVTVNRLWQMMFGSGIFQTAENLGSQGDQPSHPELLDWLARDFIASGWNTKATLRKIALSRTYRQSSKASAELLARDPHNLLLARGPARRLTAEMLRDQSLAVSGLLAEHIGGPSVKPYQPPGLWEEIAMGRPHYDQGKGDDLHRRSLYSFWKRTVPPPAMMTFDAADRSNCTVRRQSTSTPLQALALLNDVQIMEAARFLGARMLKEGGSNLDQQIRWVFRAATSRIPSAKELAVLTRLFHEQHDLFAQDTPAIDRLIAFGETKSDSSLNPPDLAAATVLAQAILNFDEAVMER